MIVMLDTGPLGRISNPLASANNVECYQWMEGLLQHDVSIYIPEIADYEVRRELIRARKIRGLARLDLLKTAVGYVPLTTSIMLKAAELWAMVRQRGFPTADPHALDGDVILAAQALFLNAVVATENVGHLSLLVDAMYWKDITFA